MFFWNWKDKKAKVCTSNFQQSMLFDKFCQVKRQKLVFDLRSYKNIKSIINVVQIKQSRLHDVSQGWNLLYSIDPNILRNGKSRLLISVGQSQQLIGEKMSL